MASHDLLSPASELLASIDAAGQVHLRKAPGTRIDLHCHTTFSDETLKYLPGMVYHPLLEPEQVYDLAKSRGMNFVTITDHDTIDGCLALLERRGPLDDFIIGEEVSVAFPQDGTVVHVNVFGHDEAQHAELQRLRSNVYEFAAYAKSIDKLFVLNHLTWTEQHRVLQTWQLEALLEHFAVFEGLNGTRSYAHNAFAWYATQGRGKVLVGGSDSHTHRVGTTYTLTSGETRDEMIAAIRGGDAAPCGAFGTPEKLREDVWLVLSKDVERRIADTHSAWMRLACRVFRRVSAALYPLACLGYHARQNVLIRDFERAMPAPVA
ncbi:MAG: PHP-associated domain-containing protein [Phycisphaerae bacterium]